MSDDLPAPVGPVMAKRSRPVEVEHEPLAEGGEALELEAKRPHREASSYERSSNSFCSSGAGRGAVLSPR